MGRSAKLHKRVKKAASSVSQASKAAVPPPAPTTQASGSTASGSANAKRRAGLKAKAATAKRAPGQEGHVLGGADYVDLMMGSRRRARQEAAKLPQSD